MPITYCKFIDANYEGTYTKFSYRPYLPVDNGDGTWTPGLWTPPVTGALAMCDNGYHVSNLQWLWKWRNGHAPGKYLFQAEITHGRGNCLYGEKSKTCTRSLRLIRPLRWDDAVERAARAYYDADENRKLRAALQAALEGQG